MSAKNAKASSSIARELTAAASSAIASVKGYTAISITLSTLASVNSSAAGSTFTATQGHLRVVGGGTKKVSAGKVASSAVAPAQGSVKVAAVGSALASAGIVTSSAVTASQGSASTVVAGTAASSALAATQGSAAAGATGSASVSARTVANHVLLEPLGYVALAAGALTMAGVSITSAFATDQDSAAAATAGNTSTSAGAATTSSVAAAKVSTVAAAKKDNTEAGRRHIAGRNAIDSVSTMTGSAISVAQGTPAYIAVTKHKPSAGYASTSAFLLSAAAKEISASTKIILLVPEKVPLGARVAVAGAIVDLQDAGFTGLDGIEAGSPAAAVHSMIRYVAKGSIFALLQSKGTLGAALVVIL